MKKHLNLIISGKIKNVGFRFMAMQAAYKYGVFGFARRKRDGKIYIEAEGEDENMENFVDWCKVGPIGAEVKEIDIEDGEVQEFTAFDVKK